MKYFTSLLAVFATVAVLRAQPQSHPQVQPPQVRTVYFLPMQHGLDQYLANRLTNSGAVHVTADPKKADAIFTDALGEALEKKLNELFPPPAETRKAAQPAPPKEDSEQEALESHEPLPPATQAKRQEPLIRPSSFRRGKGTLFLVDVHSRNVVWSTYATPKDASSAEMDRAAERIAARFESDIKAK